MMDKEYKMKALREIYANNGDPLALYLKAEKVYKMAVIDGMANEAVSPATGEIVTLLSFAPAVGVQALQFQAKLARDLEADIAELDATNGTETEDRGLVINLSKLTVNSLTTPSI